jgi:hypothetical protein
MQDIFTQSNGYANKASFAIQLVAIERKIHNYKMLPARKYKVE